MRGFAFKDRQYLTIKNHTFIVLNGFRVNRTPVFYQLTSNVSGGIVKEYLPKNWELQKGKYNGKMIFNIYNKNFFKHKSKAEKRGQLLFIAPTFEGIEYLVAKTFALPLAGEEINDRNIKIATEVFIERNMLSPADNIWSEQEFYATSIDTNNNWCIEGTISMLKRRIANA